MTSATPFAAATDSETLPLRTVTLSESPLERAHEEPSKKSTWGRTFAIGSAIVAIMADILTPIVFLTIGQPGSDLAKVGFGWTMVNIITVTCTLMAVEYGECFSSTSSGRSAYSRAFNSAPSADAAKLLKQNYYGRPLTMA